jgi:S-adenosylmethionine decarboxylase
MNDEKPFGYSYYLDMYNCREGAADDMELTYRFLERLVDRIGMTRMSQPVVMHGPTSHGVESYPEKAGVSGWVPLIESGIQIHSMEPRRFITLDLYSCNNFDKQIVLDYAKECFGFTEYEENHFARGTKYGKILNNTTKVDGEFIT